MSKFKWNQCQQHKDGWEFFLSTSLTIIDWSALFTEIDTQIAEKTSGEIFTININLRLEAGMIYIFPCDKDQVECEIDVIFGIQLEEIMDEYHVASVSLNDSDFEQRIEKIRKNLIKLLKNEFLKKDSPINSDLIIFTDIEFKIIEACFF